MPPSSRENSPHINEERTVKCPYCDEEKLARGFHLHVLRSSGNGHGEQGDVPDDFSVEDAETVGTKAVSMDYPEHRQTEQTARLCPFCEQPFRGKHGVLIHLGQVEGRKNHPEEDKLRELNPDEFPVVEVDEHDNIVEYVDEGEGLPTTRRRLSAEDRIQEYIETLREEGKDEEAERAQRMLT